MSDTFDWNAKTIAEFRANEGKVGGNFEGAPIVLMHHHGRKSGRENATACTPSNRGATQALPSMHAKPRESAPFLCSNLRGGIPRPFHPEPTEINGPNALAQPVPRLENR